MGTNGIQNLIQSQTSRKTADVIENQSFSSPIRSLTVIIPSVSRLTADGQKETTSISDYLCRNKEERNCLATSSSAISSSSSSSSKQRRMEDLANTLVPPSCINPRTTLALPPSSNSDPGSHSGPSSSLPTSARAFIFTARRIQLVDSRRTNPRC